MNTKTVLTSFIAVAGILPMLFPSPACSDIYKFVTVDGVETFTDAPQEPGSKLVIRDVAPKEKKNGKRRDKQKVHEVSLNEIAEKAVQAAIAPQDASSSFEPRLPPVGGTITSTVGMRTDPIDGKWRHHNGIDIAIPEGTPITPVAPGVVVYSGMRPGYGYTVLVEHNNGMISLYGHNSALRAANGQQVDRDTVIALSGNTGRSTGPHLHFEAWQNGTNVTPAFMPGNTMSIPASTRVASNRAKAQFRKEVLSDGSILFTNLP